MGIALETFFFFMYAASAGGITPFFGLAAIFVSLVVDQSRQSGPPVSAMKLSAGCLRIQQ
jgi:hypothetical protein